MIKNIIQAISNPNVFRPFLQDKNGKLGTWNHWRIFLHALYGLKIRPKYAPLVKQCTGRSLESLPKGGFQTCLALVGRRGGKSKIASVISAYESVLAGREENLSVGETGMSAFISASKKQARVGKNYIRAIFDQTPILQNEVVPGGTKESFELQNGIVCEMMTGDYRNIRNYSLVSCVISEICFFGILEESKVKTDTELIRAIKPSLITTGGKICCISSKYARKGWAFKTWKKHWGNEKSNILVWEGNSRLMNPTLDQRIIDEAYAEDPAAARSEYGNEWREDIAIWLPREVIESVVKKGRMELLPRLLKHKYYAFADVSGGRVEDSAMALSHKWESKTILDFVKLYKSPHDPIEAIRDMSRTLKKFGVKRITCDNYAAEFVVSSFKSCGIRAEKCKLNKSQLYLEFIPVIGSSAVELLDNETLVNQLVGLMRYTRSGGADRIDHGQGKDDLANAVAGVIYITHKPKRKVGAFFSDSDNDTEQSYGSDYGSEISKVSILAG